MDKKYLTPQEVVSILKQEAVEAGSQRALADKIGISAPYMNDILFEKRYPSHKVLKHYGLRKVVMFEVVAAGDAREGEG